MAVRRAGRRSPTCCAPRRRPAPALVGRGADAGPARPVVAAGRAQRGLQPWAGHPAGLPRGAAGARARPGAAPRRARRRAGLARRRPGRGRPAPRRRPSPRARGSAAPVAPLLRSRSSRGRRPSTTAGRPRSTPSRRPRSCRWWRARQLRAARARPAPAARRRAPARPPHRSSAAPSSAPRPPQAPAARSVSTRRRSAPHAGGTPSSAAGRRRAVGVRRAPRHRASSVPVRRAPSSSTPPARSVVGPPPGAPGPGRRAHPDPGRAPDGSGAPRGRPPLHRGRSRVDGLVATRSSPDRRSPPRAAPAPAHSEAVLRTPVAPATPGRPVRAGLQPPVRRVVETTSGTARATPPSPSSPAGTTPVARAASSTRLTRIAGSATRGPAATRPAPTVGPAAPISAPSPGDPGPGRRRGRTIDGAGTPDRPGARPTPTPSSPVSQGRVARHRRPDELAAGRARAATGRRADQPAAVGPGPTLLRRAAAPPAGPSSTPVARTSTPVRRSSGTGAGRRPLGRAVRRAHDTGHAALRHRLPGRPTPTTQRRASVAPTTGSSAPHRASPRTRDQLDRARRARRRTAHGRTHRPSAAVRSRVARRR